MAFMMEFNTICKPDRADTHFSTLHVGQSEGTQMQKHIQNKLQQMMNVLGTPDTSRSGRNTLNALRALTSRPPGFPAAWWASPGL